MFALHAPTLPVLNLRPLQLLLTVLGRRLSGAAPGGHTMMAPTTFALNMACLAPVAGLLSYGEPPRHNCMIDRVC